MTSQDRRVLVLGLSIRGVQSYTWAAIPPNLNIADFELVIAVTDCLDASAVGPEGTLPSQRQWATLICSTGAAVVFIGAPRRRLSKDRAYDLSGFVPLDFDFIAESGEGISLTGTPYRDYFMNERRYHWHIGLPSALNTASYARLSGLDLDELGITASPIAETRAGRILACRVECKRLKGSAHLGYRLAGRGASITILPAHEDALEDCVGRVLAIHGIGGQKPTEASPPWINDLLLPELENARRTLQSANESFASAKVAVVDGKAMVAKAAIPFRLLYTSGTPLETAVHEVLRELSCTVPEHHESGMDDGRFTAPTGHEFIAEIKGHKGAAKKGSSRQLVEWVDEIEERDDIAVTGILIVNGFAETPPGERPPIFAKPNIDYAIKRHLKLLSTTVLFEALVRQQRGELDLDAFWNAVADADPVVIPPWDDTPTPTE